MTLLLSSSSCLRLDLAQPIGCCLLPIDNNDPIHQWRLGALHRKQSSPFSQGLLHTSTRSVFCPGRSVENPSSRLDNSAQFADNCHCGEADRQRGIHCNSLLVIDNSYPSHQWRLGAFHRKRASHFSEGFFHTSIRRAVCLGKSVANPTSRVHNSAQYANNYHFEEGVRQLGIQCRNEVLWQRIENQSRAVRRERIPASGIVSVQQTDEENGGNGAITTEGVQGSSGRGGLKIKPSGQLSKWARARKIRAGKLTTTQKKNDSIVLPAGAEGVAVEAAESRQELVEREAAREDDEKFEEGEDYGLTRSLEGYEKSVFMISDGTGWTADHSVHAALGQFEHCMVDRRCSVNTHLFSDVNDVDRLMEIIRQAGLERGMVVYTLADPAMAEVAKEACEHLLVPHIDILGPITVALANHLGVTPLGLPRGAPGRKTTLSKQYFKRIDAVEFTIKQDDGALPKNLHLADLVLAGVSRTSKTPLSTYIAQKGYKVANVPLVYGIDPPKELFEINQDKVFGLTINANFLKAIRLARYRHLGVAEDSRSSYSDMEHIRKELEYSRKLFSQNPRWPVIEVTGKAIEETAAVILRLYHERRNKFSMPRISTRY
ncbi:unnamed protein product [Calypogeia fissa]